MFKKAAVKAVEKPENASVLNDVVSVIVRFHDIRELPKLERAIQSLHAQTDAVIQPIVVTQRFNSSDIEATSRAVARQWFFDWLPAASVVNYSDEGMGDARSDLMNLGIQRHLKLGNRFLAFLDYDDILYTHAYKILKRPLLETQVAVSFAGIEMAHAVGMRDYDFIYDMSYPFVGKNKMDLVKDNFCPLHSYLIDCSKIDPGELYFRSELNRVEDYDFLLRVAGPNPCDFSALGCRIGIYIIRSDHSNSTPSNNGSEEDREKQKVWKRNRDRLDALRSTYQVKLFASDF